jgi:predicted signal transduction protein with EAL and GGDEF domain
MSHALGKRVVAEGIEVVEQLEFLKERHCDVAQGFYLARPLATTAVTELLQARALSSQPPASSALEAGRRQACTFVAVTGMKLRSRP